MITVQSAIWVAKSQVGYREARGANGEYNNNQKYSDQLPGFGWSDEQPWCATFVQWCYWQVGVSVPKGARSASCFVSCVAYKHAGRFTEYPILGGQAFYGSNGGKHTGMVYGYDGTYVYTIEGNTNGDGSAEGNGVYRKRRVRRDSWVYGYGIPYFHGSVADTPDPKWRGRDLAA